MKLYENIFINGLPITVLVVIFAQFLFQSAKFKSSFKWTKYLIITHGIISIITLIHSFVDYQNSALIQRINGEYGLIYILLIMMNIGSSILLIIKPQLTNYKWILFMISIFINFGLIMESFVTIATSLHRDYGTFFPIKQIETLSKGLIIGISMIIIDYLTQNEKLLGTNQSIFKIMITPMLIITAYFLGDWLSSIYGFDPPYELFYTGLTLKAFALALGLFLMMFYLETLFKLINPKK